jgi:hypothetical protein
MAGHGKRDLERPRPSENRVAIWLTRQLVMSGLLQYSTLSNNILSGSHWQQHAAND